MKAMTIICSQRVMGVEGAEIYAIMLQSSGFSVAHYICTTLQVKQIDSIASNESVAPTQFGVNIS